MSTELPDIGSPPSEVQGDLRRFLIRLRDHVRELRGSTGDPAGAASSGGGSTTVVVGGGSGSGSGSTAPDPTPPPTPSGVTLVAGFDFVGIVTDGPLFTQGHGYARTKVYGAKYSGTGPLPTFASAVLVHEFVGEVGSFPSPPDTEWHIWLKWRTIDGYDSVAPSGGTNGDDVTTGADIALLLAALTGQIDVSQLSSSLAATISTLQTDVAALNSTPAWDIAATYSADDLVAYSGKLYKALRTTVGDQPNTSPLDWLKVGDYDTLAGVVAAHTASIADHESRITSTASGLTAEIAARTALAATVGTNTAAIAAETSARASADSANATAISTVAAVVNNPTSGVAANYAAINTEASARASADASLFARYAIKLDVNGYVVGWELNNNGSSGNFNVLASTFSVGAPGQAGITPFVVRTVPTTENGVAIPPGIYADAAYFVNLQAMIAKFGNAAITSAQIQSLAASKITSGAVTVGAVIKSSNYIANTSGWAIRGDGTMEIQQIVARGNIYADDGYFRGDVTGARGIFRGGVRGGAFTSFAWPAAHTGGGYYINTEGLKLGNRNTYEAGGGGGYFQIDTDTGNVYAPNFQIVNGNLTMNGGGTFSGALSAASGTFRGALVAATGTFSGSFTAEAVNAVRTVNIAGEAIVVARLAQSRTAVSIGITGPLVLLTLPTINIPAEAPATSVALVISLKVSVSGLAHCYVKVQRDGADLETFDFPDVSPVGSTSDYSFAYQVLDTPGVGDHVYRIICSTVTGGGNGASFHDRSVLLLGAKR